MTSTPQRPVDARVAFRRLMAWTGGAAVVTILGALIYLGMQDGELPWHMILATNLGDGFTVLLGGGLMALVVLSANSGPADEVREPLHEKRGEPFNTLHDVLQAHHPPPR